MGGNAVKAGEPAVQATVIGVDVLHVKRPFDANTRGQTYRYLGMGVQRVGPAIAGFFSNLTPLFAALLSAAFLGELPHLYHAVAFVLIVGGLWCRRGGEAKRSVPAGTAKRRELRRAAAG